MLFLVVRLVLMLETGCKKILGIYTVVHLQPLMENKKVNDSFNECNEKKNEESSPLL